MKAIKNKFLACYKLFISNIKNSVKYLNDNKLSPDQEIFLMINNILSFYVQVWSFYDKLICNYFCDCINESHFGDDDKRSKIKNFFIDIVIGQSSNTNFTKNIPKWDDYGETYKQIVIASNRKFLNQYVSGDLKQNLSNHFKRINKYRNDYSHSRMYDSENPNPLGERWEDLLNKLINDVYLLNIIYYKLTKD